MSLANRLLMFFLGTLGVVLLGFSATMYALGWSYLHRRVDDHLVKSLTALESSVHVEADGLEWKPEERRITIGLDPSPEQVRWKVQDARGRVLDRSANWEAGPSPPVSEPGALAGAKADVTILEDSPVWRIGRRRLLLATMIRQGRGDQTPIPHDRDPDDDEYDEMILTAALVRAPVDASIARLGVALAVASTSTWLLCAALGGWLCRRALAPIARLAAAAREKAAADDQDGLPTPETGDELEELGRAFNALLERRREALERQRRFTGDASHQLRTPIAGVLSLVDVVRRRPRPSEDYEQALDQIRREALRLHRIVESLLFLARAESDAEPLREEPIDLAAWVPELLRSWEGRPRASDLQLTCESPSVWARAHPPLLAQAVENLVDNALKYSEAGSLVTVEVRREPGTAVLSVADRGCGLTADERISAFEPFYQSPRARLLGRGGVGLGLSVVQRIVRASHGSLGVESVPGAGSRFTIRLPEAETSRIDDFDPSLPNA
ncbi:sensor histidine kinase [Planctomyces sp. SH-PL62]|uniref:sensor histidine kinase n=1 Tax=Planctomyces sp. SH-PL62 TaxID=1636152 RepID=UPI00078D2183|nr:HAMP domain-containing sensor histidine kinase [Planctomyces sp. SH-PL62]AMV38295.1 putative sensor histidine kinase TcrY [Planctomyces sp. SH-PL62]